MRSVYGFNLYKKIIIFILIRICFTILILAVVAFLVLQNKGYYVFLNVWKFHLWISMIIPKIEIKKKKLLI